MLEAQKRAVASRKERQKREKAEMDASMEEETDEGAEGAGAQDAWAAEADEAAAYANRFKIVTNPPKKQKLRGKTRCVRRFLSFCTLYSTICQQSYRQMKSHSCVHYLLMHI